MQTSEFDDILQQLSHKDQFTLTTGLARFGRDPEYIDHSAPAYRSISVIRRQLTLFKKLGLAVPISDYQRSLMMDLTPLGRSLAKVVVKLNTAEQKEIDRIKGEISSSFGKLRRAGLKTELEAAFPKNQRRKIREMRDLGKLQESLGQVRALVNQYQISGYS